jgi:hypothetical protein
MDMMKNMMIGAIMNGVTQLKKNINKFYVKMNLKTKNVQLNNPKKNKLKKLLKMLKNPHMI